MATSFETFDSTPYQRAPRLNLVGALALGRALVELRPDQAPPQLHRIAGKLELLIAEAEASLTTRRRESAPAYRTHELSLDNAADSLWSMLRDRLDTWGAFEHPGLAGVVRAHSRRSTTAVVLAQARGKAAQARELSGRLFGSGGLAFLRLPYPEQAQSMASILRLIDEDELSESIDELAGPELMVALVACQAQYEAMVEARMSRIIRKSGDLGLLRARLQRTIRRYTNAVLTLLDEDEPASLDIVLTALRPIEVLRARSSRAGGRSEARAVEAEIPDAELAVGR